MSRTSKVELERIIEEKGLNLALESNFAHIPLLCKPLGTSEEAFGSVDKDFLVACLHGSLIICTPNSILERESIIALHVFQDAKRVQAGSYAWPLAWYSVDELYITKSPQGKYSFNLEKILSDHPVLGFELQNLTPDDDSTPGKLNSCSQVLARYLNLITDSQLLVQANIRDVDYANVNWEWSPLVKIWRRCDTNLSKYYLARYLQAIEKVFSRNTISSINLQAKYDLACQFEGIVEEAVRHFEPNNPKLIYLQQLNIIDSKGKIKDSSDSHPVAKLCLNEIKRRNLGDRFITLVRSKLGSKKLQSLVENEAGKLTMKFIKELFSLDEKYLLRTCFEATEYTLETMIGAILAYKSQIVDSDELVESVLSEIILLCQSEQYAYNESDCLTAFKIYRQLELQKVLIEDMPLPKKPVKKESLAEIATKLLLDGEPYPKAVLAMIGDGFAASLKDTSHSLVLPEEDEGAIVESEIYRALVQEVLSKYKEIMGPELGWVAGIFSKKILSPGRHHIEFLSSFAKMDVISEPHCVSVLLCLLFSICDPEHADQTAPINIKYKELLVSNLARLGIAIVFDEKFKSPIAVNFNKDLNRRSFSEVSTIVDSSDFPEPAGKWLQNVLDKIGCKSSAPVNH